MGINLGAFIAPLICGYLGQNIAWHLGFAAAGVGMLLGLVQYVLSGRYLGDAGMHPVPAESPAAAAALRRKAILIGGSLAALLAIFAVGGAMGWLPITAVQVADAGGVLLLAARRRLLRLAATSSRTGRPKSASGCTLVGVLFVAAALFWSVFEQAGSTLNLFADRNTHNVLFGWAYPEQLVPVAELAVHHRARAGVRVAVDPPGEGTRSPRRPAKFAIGLVFVGLGFAVLIVAGARRPKPACSVSPSWLTLTYLLHTIGELSLSPVGLSAMTKLAPGADRRPDDGRLVPGRRRWATTSAAASPGCMNRSRCPRSSWRLRCSRSSPGSSCSRSSSRCGACWGKVTRPAPIESGARTTTWCSKNTNRSGTSRPRPSRRATRSWRPRARKRRRRRKDSSSACRSTWPATCTTTSGSNGRASCCPGPCPRGRRSIRRPSGWRCTSRITRSSTARSRASSPRATAPASSCSGIRARGGRRARTWTRP